MPSPPVTAAPGAEGADPAPAAPSSARMRSALATDFADAATGAGADPSPTSQARLATVDKATLRSATAAAEALDKLLQSERDRDRAEETLEDIAKRVARISETRLLSVAPLEPHPTEPCPMPSVSPGESHQLRSDIAEAAPHCSGSDALGAAQPKLWSEALSSEAVDTHGDVDDTADRAHVVISSLMGELEACLAALRHHRLPSHAGATGPPGAPPSGDLIRAPSPISHGAPPGDGPPPAEVGREAAPTPPASVAASIS